MCPLEIDCHQFLQQVAAPTCCRCGGWWLQAVPACCPPLLPTSSWPPASGPRSPPPRPCRRHTLATAMACRQSLCPVSLQGNVLFVGLRLFRVQLKVTGAWQPYLTAPIKHSSGFKCLTVIFFYLAQMLENLTQKLGGSSSYLLPFYDFFKVK